MAEKPQVPTLPDLSKDWILLVEDDKIFCMLFGRSWSQKRPAVEVVVAPTLGAMKAVLESAERPPCLIVVDQTLPDGDGHQAVQGLSIASHCWSALGDGGVAAKPQGKSALEAAVDSLAAKAGL